MSRETDRIQRQFSRMQPATEARPDFRQLRQELLVPDPLRETYPRRVSLMPSANHAWLRATEVPFPVAPANPDVPIMAGAWLPSMWRKSARLTLLFDRTGREQIIAVGTSGASLDLHSAIESAYPGALLEPWMPGLLDRGCFSLLEGVPSAESNVAMLPLNRLAKSAFPAPYALWLNLMPVGNDEVDTMLGDLAAEETVAKRYSTATAAVSAQLSPQRSESLQRESGDPDAALYLEDIRRMMKRLRSGTAAGLWRWSAMLWAPHRETCEQLSRLVCGFISGGKGEGDMLRYRTLDLEPFTAELGVMVEMGRSAGMSLASIASSEELGPLSHLPTDDAPGYATYPVARFAVAPPAPRRSAGEAVYMGNVLDVNRRTDTPWLLSHEVLTRHVFVAGVTGAGKSNTCLHLLSELNRAGIPFWVLEPVKRDYRQLLNQPELRDRLSVYTLGDETVAPLRLNLFQPPAGVLLSEWIGGLKAVISSSFSLYGSMPQLLERALYEVYQTQGWNCERDRVSERLLHAFPTLSLFADTLETVVDRAGYGRELAADFHGALSTRVRSLMLGSIGKMLNTAQSLDIRALLRTPTVFELASITNDRDASLVMGVLLLNLGAVRRQDGMSAALRHVTLIEEAHRLLPAVGPYSEGTETAQTRTHAVNLFMNMLAELRSAGESFLLADQSPEKIVSDAIKNTGTKIIHRLLDRRDRDLIGDAAVLNPVQKNALPRLKDGVAAVFTEGCNGAFLVQVPEIAELAPISDARIRQTMKNQIAISDVEPFSRAMPPVPVTISGDEDRAEPKLLDGVDLLASIVAGSMPTDATLQNSARYMADRAAFLGLSSSEASRLQSCLDGARDRSLQEDARRRHWNEFLAGITEAMARTRRRRQPCADCPSRLCYGAEIQPFVASLALWRSVEELFDGKESAPLKRFHEMVTQCPGICDPLPGREVAPILTECLGIQLLGELAFPEPWKLFKGMM